MYVLWQCVNVCLVCIFCILWHKLGWGTCMWMISNLWHSFWKINRASLDDKRRYFVFAVVAFAGTRHKCCVGRESAYHWYFFQVSLSPLDHSRAHIDDLSADDVGLVMKDVRTSQVGGLLADAHLGSVRWGMRPGFFFCGRFCSFLVVL